jgi:hypothetical protein
VGKKARSVEFDKVFVVRFREDPASQPTAWRGVVTEVGEFRRDDKFFEHSGLSDACKKIAEQLKKRS